MKNYIFIIFFMLTNLAFSQDGESIFNKDKKTVVEYFKAEGIGGKLDFAMRMKDDERELYMFDKVIYNRKDFSIFMWGQAIKRTNHFTKKKAAKFWEEIYGRELTKPERKALYRGFTTDI